MKKKNRLRIASQVNESKMIGRQLSFAALEAYKLLRTNLMFALPEDRQESDGTELWTTEQEPRPTARRKHHVIGITSSESGEGKSTTALNLAYVLAEASNDVLLLEADMRLPVLYRRMGLKQSPGLSNLLAGFNSGNQVLQKSDLHPRLYMVTSGDIPPNPSELLGSKQMEITVEVFSREFDYIILDLPPVNEVSDALVASKLTDGMLMIVRQNKTTRGSVSEAMRQLKYANAKVLGFVVTCAEGETKNYKKHSYYSDGEGKRSKA